MQNRCPVCALVETTERPRYRDRKFVVFDPCFLCAEPVMIIRKHLTSLTEKDKEDVMEIIKELYGRNARFTNEPKHDWRHVHYHIKR